MVNITFGLDEEFGGDANSDGLRINVDGLSVFFHIDLVEDLKEMCVVALAHAEQEIEQQ